MMKNTTIRVLVEEAFRAISGGFLVFLNFNLAYRAAGITTPNWVFILWLALTVAIFVVMVPIRLITGRELKFNMSTAQSWTITAAFIAIPIIMWSFILDDWPGIWETLLIIITLGLLIYFGPRIWKFVKTRQNTNITHDDRSSD